MVLENISKFVVQTSFLDIPEDAMNYTKKLILSFLGGAIAGSVQPAGKILSGYLKAKGGIPESGVIASKFRIPVAESALANGTFAHASELEDDSFPECCVMYSLIPAVLSLGEKLRASGIEILESIVIGYDVQAKISLAADIPWARGFAGFTFGWGAAASAAKLLRLSIEQTKMAMSVSADLLCGWARQTGSMVHMLEAGIGAGNGIFAALLAKEGFTGAPDILETKGGLWDTLHFPKEGLDRVPKLISEPFRVLEVGIKKYSCCYIEQRIIDGTLELKKNHSISWQDVDNVEVHVGPYFQTLVHYPDPINATEARFSVEHSIVAALSEEKVSLDVYTDENALNPKYKEGRKKVKVIVHPEWPAGVMGGSDEVIIRIKDGKVYNKKCEKAKGDPPLYLTDEEVMSKFRNCAEFAGFLSPSQIEWVKELVFKIEKIRDISRLMEIVTFGV
jgi:2-methylcitrate dehydratase PrpD